MSKQFYHLRKLVGLCLLMSLPFLSVSQKLIAGKIISSKDHSPIPGVSVVIKGSTKGTSSNIDGQFVINAKQGDVLAFSGIGVKPSEITVGNDPTVTVTLDLEARAMTEVVV